MADNTQLLVSAAKNLAALVRDMREAQKSYFASQETDVKRQWLERSKSLERRVDEAITNFQRLERLVG